MTVVYIARRTKAVSEMLPELYLHGLAEGDFDLALRGLWASGSRSWSGPRLLMVAHMRFGRLNAPELLAKVYMGVRYEDGIEVTGKEVAA